MARDFRRVVAVTYDGLALFEFGIVTEVFSLPRPELRLPNWYTFQVCSIEDHPLRASGGVHVKVERGLRCLGNAGTIVLPGWRDPDEMPPAPLLNALRRAYVDGARLVSICSGVFVLAATGLLADKRVTTHWRYAERLRAKYPNVQVEPDVLYVDQGRILTSAGSAAGIDLCLHIVRRDFGAEIANQVARRLVVPPHRDGGQAQYVPEAVRKDNGGGLARVLDWAQANLQHELRVEDLAKKAAMSPRTFARRFRQESGTTPHQWLTHQRVLAAQRRLETSDDSVDEVAEAVGLQTAATLRLLFRKKLMTTPTDYRKRFSRHL